MLNRTLNVGGGLRARSNVVGSTAILPCLGTCAAERKHLYMLRVLHRPYELRKAISEGRVVGEKKEELDRSRQTIYTCATTMLTMPRMLALLALSVALVSAKPLQPHILFVMADDLGWSTVGWHCKATPSPAVKTPALDALVAEGASLDRHYTYWFCSPSRSAFLSGRLPIHVNQLNTPPCDWNEATGEGAGIGTNMTAIAEVLRDAGYATAQVGKVRCCWHC